MQSKSHAAVAEEARCFLLLLFIGAFIGLHSAKLSTMIEVLSATGDEHYVGRLNGLMTPVFTGFLLIGTGVSGIYMTATSLMTVYVTAGIILMAASLISLRFTQVNLPA